MLTYKRWLVGVSTVAPHRAIGGFSNREKDFLQVPTERPAAWYRFLQVSAAPRTAGLSSNSGSLVARFLYCVVLVVKWQREKRGMGGDRGPWCWCIPEDWWMALCPDHGQHFV